jgi:DNA-binding NtrC family response regulator
MKDLLIESASPQPFLQLARIAVEQANESTRFGRLYGTSEPMRKVYRMIGKVAPTEATVMVIGESGCGKELVANTIHDMSQRRNGPFLAVNCGAIPANLIEAELFGYEKGAFTGAGRTHRGFFERASGGTLFLDEITEMAPEMQVRLLRVLESGMFARVGGETEVRSDTRIIAATNREPIAAVHAGRLREDLMYRLSVFPIELPPLRTRGEDIELLARHFVSEFNRACGADKRLSAEAVEVLGSHSWPGNVRELRNVLQRAFILSDEVIEVDAAGLSANELLKSRASAARLQFDIGVPLAEMERQTIFATLEHFRGNKRRCAEVLGVSLKTLYNRLSEYDADPCAVA